MNLWITYGGSRYYATAGDAHTWDCGNFKRAVRAVLKLLKADKTIKRVVLPSAREHKRWSRVENPDHEELQQPLIHYLEAKSIELTVAPGVSDRHPWPQEKVSVPKIKAGEKPKDNRVVIYTDGSCLGNPGFGGWGFCSKLRSGSGAAPDVTNNMMEMTAVLEALKFFRRKHPGAPLKIITDSRYVINGCTNWRHKWAAKGFTGIKNADLWKALAREVSLADVQFFWVKGHNGTPGNERADKLAGDAARALKDAA